jgi:alkylation response protein AidB-like acyl-CoA dehydrogenase
VDALLSEEEALLEQTVDALLEHSVPTAVRDLLAFEDATLWPRLAAADLLGLGVPSDLGGVGTYVDVVIAVEAFGRALAPAPFLGSSVLAAQLLSCAGAAPEVLAPLIDDQARLAVALEADLGRVAEVTDAAAVALDAAGADAALAVLDGRLVLVEVGEELDGFDPTRAVRAVHLERVAAPLAHERPVTSEVLEAWSARAWIALAADTVGVMDGALRSAVEHAKGREQFGVPIGSFQAVQHLLAEAYTTLSGARSLTRFAAWALAHRGGAESHRAARTAKAYCAEGGKTVCEAVVQVYGGTGMTWECPAHLYLRRALLNRRVLGDELDHLHALSA